MQEFQEFSPIQQPPAPQQSSPAPQPPAPVHSAQLAVSRTYMLMLVLTVLLGLLVIPYAAERFEYAVTRGRQRARAEIARAELATRSDPTNRFRLVAQAIEPSVVGVDTLRVVDRRSLRSELLGGSRFQAEGQGSGVIMDERGYILTNFHVIDEASQVDVELSDGRTFHGAQVVGADPFTDLAVLKINAGTLTPADWGDSDELEVGDDVVAIGNPFGLTRTVTAGIVSAKERSTMTSDGFQEFLQTDAAVNPGNSGGPLLNLRGEVVGINTAIYGQSYQGISFAIPSRLARQVYEKLVSGDAIERGWLGVAMDELTEEDARQLGLEDTRGVLIQRVLADSPAQRAGVRAGDVIVAFNGRETANRFELSRAVAGTKIGSKAEIDLTRDGKSLTITVTVGRRSQEVTN